MAELRRLLIKPFRLKTNIGIDNVLPLSRHEVHYLRRVLRLRGGDVIETGKRKREARAFVPRSRKRMGDINLNPQLFTIDT